MPRKATLQLYTSIGEQILTQGLSGGRNQVDLSRLADGAYVLKIEDTHRIIKTQKIIITK